MNKVFIDGSAGTTGLRIRERLEAREDIRLITLPEAQRKELSARLEAVAEADISILCLPDAAAKELAALAPPSARLIDTSTAHRTTPGWVYGFPELTGRAAIREASRI
ncbi:MAG: N-acetyl-gamma-glutamyl-phosphate reductase, partial [bacterium]